MKPREYFSPRAWTDLAFEMYCRLTAGCETPPKPSWPLDAQRLNATTIEWPVKYEWDAAEKWVSPLLTGLKSHTRVELTDCIPQHRGLVLFKAKCKDRSALVAVDYSDNPNQIDEKRLRQCDLYFKMQYLKNGYGADRIIPGMYVPLSMEIYTYIPYLRSIRKRTKLKYQVYGRFGAQFAFETRKRAVEILESQKLFAFEGSLKKNRYSRYLREIASSKICIDLPGNGDFCFRFIEYMAVGACIIGPPHSTTLYPALEDRKHVVYCKSDFSDLVDLCAHYLEHEDERNEIVENSVEYFDRYLNRRQLGAYYLHRVLEQMG